MKILILAPYPPYPPRGGGQQRMYQLIRHLASRHQIDLLTFSPNAEATAALAPLREFCRITTVPSPSRTTVARLQTTLASPVPDMLWRGYSPVFARELIGLLKSVQPDIVQAESIETTQYAPQLRATGPLWVYDSWNVEYTIQQRAAQTDVQKPATWAKAAYSLIQWQKLRRYEQRLSRRFAGVFAVSEPDQQLFRQLDPTLRTAVAPNGVDTAYFSQRSAQPTEPIVLFTGTLDYRPNVDALQWFVAEVWPLIRSQRPTARFQVVGRNPLPAVRALASQPGVEVVGEVADTRPFFEQAAVYAVPMRIGGGVRLKVLEAFAQALPVVSTTLGVEGIGGFVAGREAVLADEPGQFAAAVIRLFDDPAQASALGGAARQLALAFDWAQIVPRIEQAWAGWLAAR